MNTAGVIFPYWGRTRQGSQKTTQRSTSCCWFLFSLCPIVSLIILIFREIRSAIRKFIKICDEFTNRKAFPDGQEW